MTKAAVSLTTLPVFSDRRTRNAIMIAMIKTVPDLSSDKWTVLGAVHVRVKGYLKILWRKKNIWVNAGHTYKEKNG